MIGKLNFPNPSGPVPPTPIVYVKDKTIWQYKALARNLAKEEVPSEYELNELGKGGWELTGMLTHGTVLYLYFKRLRD